jgi:DNA-binding CsgD family transcriptional regulator
VGVCFLLGSTGWLSWLYCVASLVGPSEADFHTMVLGYLAQVLGLGAYMLARARVGGRVATRAALASVVLYVVLLEPATMSGDAAATLGFGYAMNVLCGYVQGHYLTCLAELVEPRGRGVVFGAGYAASTLATWLLSGVADGMLTVGVWNLATCVMLALAALACIWLVDRLLLPGTALQVPAAAETEAPGAAASQETSGGGEEITTGPAPWCSAVAPDRSLLILAGVSVVVMSLVKNVGFSFPTADLSGVVDLEMSRLFYGVGLVAAIAAFAVRHGLSEREREVLPLVVRRLTNARIAEELFITEATVKYHVRNILKKTGCANRVEVIGLYDDERGSAESGVAEQRGAERKGA